MDGDTPLNKVRSVYRPLVVTTKLSSIVSMKKKKKKKQTVLVAATHGIIHNKSDDDTQGKQAKKKGSVYVIEDTEREREKEKERQREERQKKYEWNSMLAWMEAVRLRRIFNSSLLLCLFPFPLVHDCITQSIRNKRKREKCIFNIRNFETSKRTLSLKYVCIFIIVY